MFDVVVNYYATITFLVGLVNILLPNVQNTETILRKSNAIALILIAKKQPLGTVSTTGCSKFLYFIQSF